MSICSQTALLHAAKHNHHQMVADLIRLGADVNATNNMGKSCLHLSAERGFIKVLEVRARLLDVLRLACLLGLNTHSMEKHIKMMYLMFYLVKFIRVHKTCL